jgi:hypothetical protein
MTSNPGLSTSVVVVINGSRRPIRNVSCLVYTDDGPGPGPAARISPSSCALILPGTSRQADTAVAVETPIRTLRPGGQAEFRFTRQKADCPGGEADVTFTDDAGFTWSLTSDLALSLM